MCSAACILRMCWYGVICIVWAICFYQFNCLMLLSFIIFMQFNLSEFFQSLLIFEFSFAFVKHLDIACVWNINKPAMAFDMSCFGVITGAAQNYRWLIKDISEWVEEQGRRKVRIVEMNRQTWKVLGSDGGSKQKNEQAWVLKLRRHKNIPNVVY